MRCDYSISVLVIIGSELKRVDDNIAITFLLTVNDTWYPDEHSGKTCLHTVKTPLIKPNIPWNESVNIVVGNCDHGPLTYTVYKQLDGMSLDKVACTCPTQSSFVQVLKSTRTLRLHFFHQ